MMMSFFNHNQFEQPDTLISRLKWIEVTNSVSAKYYKSINPLLTSFLRRQESNIMLKAITTTLDPLHSRGDDNFK
jgi:hypothetical protein